MRFIPVDPNDRMVGQLLRIGGIAPEARTRLPGEVHKIGHTRPHRGIPQSGVLVPTGIDESLVFGSHFLLRGDIFCVTDAVHIIAAGQFIDIERAPFAIDDDVVVVVLAGFFWV